MNQAAARIGHNVHQVYRWAQFFPDFATELDSAIVQGRSPNTPHGTQDGYLVYMCRCSACREWCYVRRASWGSLG